ncbi:flavodoxin family protein [Caldicellulosiruptor morganii]|uniref:Flavodoxin family protein n=1 Tax=Caldicellulosiruptor morganii TaxID=1387555 RepID=A0ABY7BJY8_9FIRM|nr:flavodoxin family protein [Caldicellulosiruptor morganii]WAM33128.1 flavodoxin family protein [Caldicellulosiruptor morganii]
MRNIFVYVGSRNGEASKTLKIINEILKKVYCLVEDKSLNISVFHPQNSYIERCRGCISCFFYGKCPLDSTDDMGKLKSEMLKADFIIFGTPIYAANVSGDMKVFFDRISYWMHLLRLCGKPAIAVTTSTGNGISFVSEYLYIAMSFLGLKVIKQLNAAIFDLSQLEEDNLLKQEIDNCSRSIYEYLMGNKKVEADKTMEVIFSNLKKAIIGYEKMPNYEYLFWKNNGLLECKTFNELLQKKSMLKDFNIVEF